MRTNAVNPGTDPSPDDDAAVEAAMKRVLDAEHEARVRVGRAAATAEAMVEDAGAAARAVAERAERRIGALRLAFEVRAAGAVAALAAQAADADIAHPLTRADVARLEAAVVALAARLTRAG
jgi:hypothetical protein